MAVRLSYFIIHDFAVVGYNMETQLACLSYIYCSNVIIFHSNQCTTILLKKLSQLSLPDLKIDLTTIDKYKSGSNLPLFVVGRSKIRLGHTEVN